MKLDLQPAREHPDLLAPSTFSAIEQWKGTTPVETIEVAEIDPSLADTAAFCEHYGVSLHESVNCVVIAAKRGEDVRLAACLVRATTRADVNGLVRRHFGARKASFASMDLATRESAMEYGGITPVGLPENWPILLDASVLESDHVIVGSGVRHSKLWLPPAVLAELPSAEVLEGLGLPVN